MRLTALAPAKINRELRVGGLRPDGYHEVRSRIVSISLADRLSAEAASELSLSCDAPELIASGENLVTRAARLLAARAGIAAGASIALEKRVPVGGGLGGGSADAAVALRLLARLWRLRQADSAFAELAAELGSDVPFFLAGGEADVEGRGEVVTPVPDGASADLLLLVPPFSISTSAVYRRFAGRGVLPERLDVASPSERFLGPNDLAPAVLEEEPRMWDYVESAARTTADHAISGSGAAIVLHGAGAEAESLLRGRHPEARIIRCRTLSREEHARWTDPTGGVS